MPTYKDVVLSDQAVVDLRNIGEESSRNWGKEQKSRYLRQIDDRFDVILENSEIGVLRVELAAGTRVLMVNRHAIYYRLDAPRIVVIRILHMSMDVTSHLDD